MKWFGFAGLIGCGLGLGLKVSAAVVFSDNFAASTLNSGTPAPPTSSAAAYQLLSSKTWSPAPTIGANRLKFGIGPTTSGHIEVQARFTTTPVTLTTVGDFVELTVVFTNSSGLFFTNGHVGFGLYDSAGSLPIAGGMNSTAVNTTTGVTGGAQPWQGYVARIAYNGGSHRIATRPALFGDLGHFQDVVTEGSSSQSYPGAVNLASTAATTLAQATNLPFTHTLRYTLGAASTLQIDSRLYSGPNTNGAVLVNQTATASGANFLTSSFDSLAVGWRITAGGVPTLMDISSILVTTSVNPGQPDNTVAGIFFQQQPTSVNIGMPITPPVTVLATNASGGPISGTTISVTLNSGTGDLNGTLAQLTDANGVASFGNLSFTAAGAKQLQANSGPNTALSSSFNVTLPPPVAFPGAAGAGANASGGRGGDVYYVTTLANTGAGSLRNGISGAPASGRTILFNVSGNIELASTLTINRPNITIAGQTAPGAGICLQNYAFNIAANNIILRHVRTRLGTNAQQEADAMWINSGTNIIVDHVSASWSVDETLSTSRSVANLTVQNCFITESLWRSIHSKGEHGYGGIISAEADATFTYHHNLYAHHTSRNPRIGSDAQSGTLRLDFRNNVVYNWGFYAGYSGGETENVEVNYVNNYFVAGPYSTQTRAFMGGATTTKVYQSGNFIDNNKNGLFDGSNTGWSMFGGTLTQLATPLEVPAMTTDSAPVALQRTLAQSGAMPWRRDAYDQRIARSVRTQTGQHIDFVASSPFAGDYLTNNINGTNFIGVNPWPALASAPAPTDTDNDGMPDFWELAVGLNLNLSSDRNITNSATGYTRLEDYLNWRAEAHALCPRNGFVDVSLRSATGEATNLTYAVASGTNGTVMLLADGYTARFTAAPNTSGLANFTFTATGNGVTFGPMNYGILVTTTNAPAVNTPPVLATITNRVLIAGNIVNFTASASDPDTPPQTITFTLQNAPGGATLGSSSGTFNWRPTIAQSPATNTLSIVATDNGLPPLSATQHFTLTVVRPSPPEFQTISSSDGSLQFQITGDPGPDYTIEASTNLVHWLPLTLSNAPALPWSWSDPQGTTLPQRFYRVLLGP